MEIAKHCGWWLPYKEFVIASEKPTEIHMSGDVLHKDGGAAIKYRDGFAVWALNGVRVTQYLAETPAEELDPLLIVKEKNVEVRREIVRKYGENGQDKLFNHPKLKKNIKIIDKGWRENMNPWYNDFIRQYEKDNNVDLGLKKKKLYYELVELDLEDGNPPRPYLRFENASVKKVWHFEGVENGIKTLDEAIEFRNGTKYFPAIVT